ncbi:unnamed protein product [Tuber aestivum]|uniref:Calcineurin-like phosphoesterase domain-containing protein n=1 Tax=Tuber aestivum TaxID=59557 RepID=A0A292Q847_9PEZI|nr:unnamed protein product [Tuber aestivum]
MASRQVQLARWLASFIALIWPHLTVVNLLRLLWLSTVYYDERHVYKSAMATCDWDNWENWGPETVPHRVVLIADPQIIDRHTYARRDIALSATIFYTDLYMSRSYDSIINHLNPSTVIFLGDLFDGGREWDSDRIAHHHTDALIPDDPAGFPDWKEFKDEYWLSEHARFSQVFPSTPYRKTVQSLPGNHDIGVGNSIKESVLERFRLFFGEGNSLLTLGNHSIILLDTPSLLNDVNPRIYSPPRDFLDSFPDLLSPTPLHPHVIQDASPLTPPSLAQASPKPVILLSHIPLHRPPDTSCGPHRQSRNPIRIGSGYQYTNTLPEPLSQEILHKTGAKHVFSGDDHDACTVTHEYDDGKQKAEEVTVRTFAWTMGVRQPGFLMVSLLNDGLRNGKETVLVHECLLPDQIGIYLGYVELLVQTLIIVLLNIARRRGALWWWCRCLKPGGGRDEDRGRQEGLLGIIPGEKNTEMEEGAGKKRNRQCSGEFWGELRDLVIVVVPFYLTLLALW